jgi:hypothetical protein
MRAEDIQIDDPCIEPESKMLPRESGRYCLRCQKHVYDLSDMTEDEAIAFFELNVRRGICVSYLSDAEGNVQHVARRPSAQGKGVSPLIGGAVLLAACNTSQPSGGEAPSAVRETQLQLADPVDSSSEHAPAPTAAQTSVRQSQAVEPSVSDSRLDVVAAPSPDTGVDAGCPMPDEAAPPPHATGSVSKGTGTATPRRLFRTAGRPMLRKPHRDPDFCKNPVYIGADGIKRIKKGC